MVKRLHLLFIVLRRSGVYKLLLGFLGVYLACALVVLLAEPNIVRYEDALWFLWAVSTTVGLGDITAVTFPGRIVTVICSLYAILTTAIITGVTVDYFNEERQRQYDASLTMFLDKLERLPELDQDELAAIARKVKRNRTDAKDERDDL